MPCEISDAPMPCALRHRLKSMIRFRKEQGATILWRVTLGSDPPIPYIDERIQADTSLDPRANRQRASEYNYGMYFLIQCLVSMYSLKKLD